MQHLSKSFAFSTRLPILVDKHDPILTPTKCISL